MEDIDIIELKPEDWEAFKNLRLKIMLSDPAAYAHTYDDSVKLPEKRWREIVANNKIIGAKKGNELVGMIGAQYKSENDEKFIILFSIGVASEYRKMGIAKKMMQALIDKMKEEGINKIKLWVSETQKPAIAFYESFGFKYVGKKENEVKLNGETYDELIMEKDLP